MSKMYEEINKNLMTKDDIAAWLDRPPSNDDLDLCQYLANAVKLKYEFGEKIEQAIKIINKYLYNEEENIHYRIDELLLVEVTYALLKALKEGVQYVQDNK